MLAFGIAAALLFFALAQDRCRGLAAPLALLLALAYFRAVNSLQSVAFVNRFGRDHIQLLFLSLLFCARPRGPRETELFAKVLAAAICFPYFSAGLYKLFHGGADLWSGRVLQAGLADWWISGARPASRWLAEQGPVCAALTGVMMLAELLSPLAVLFRPLRPALAVYAVCFHLFSYFFVGPDFLGLFLPTFFYYLLPLRDRLRPAGLGTRN